MTSTLRPRTSSSPTPAAWVGGWQCLLQTPVSDLLAALEQHLPNSSTSQVQAWEQELNILKAVAQQVQGSPAMQGSQLVLEYNLPREAGRRPDVVLLLHGQTIVLEFKGYGTEKRIDLDQAYGYARDLRDYHSAFVRHSVRAFLVLASASNRYAVVDRVTIVSPDCLAKALLTLAPPPDSDIITVDDLLSGVYSPLPTLVTAARCLFNRQPLPSIKRARSSGVEDAVQQVLAEAQAAQKCGDRRLVLVTGVPGAGKTLIGLQVAHRASNLINQEKNKITATFLSGNGPLVKVLQDSLRSKAFVQDMHAFIREYGIQHPDRVPPEHILIFDEAQRAWDQSKMDSFYTSRNLLNPNASEPDLLIQISERLEKYAIILALVGSGQEIHTGEESGIQQWSQALQKASKTWQVVGPPSLKLTFQETGFQFRESPLLNL